MGWWGGGEGKYAPSKYTAIGAPESPGAVRALALLALLRLLMWRAFLGSDHVRTRVEAAKPFAFCV